MPHLLKEPTHPEGVDEEFLREAVNRFEEDESLPDVFTQAMLTISNKLSAMSMESDYQPHVRVWLYLASWVYAFVLTVSRRPYYSTVECRRY